MKKTYTTLRRGCQLSLVAATLLLAGQASAQNAFAYGSTSATNVAGTFTDLSTNGTAITTANNDDANSTAQNIGFSFSYNGASFTQFVLNTNGLMRLGGAAPSAANMFGQYQTDMAVGVEPISSTNAADVNLLMPFNFDLQQGTSTAEYRVYTSGTAGSRVCTIQWKNVSDKAGTTNPKQYANFTFQVKLYETSNTIEFVYGTATAGSGTPGARYPTVGIKGSSGQGGQDVLANKLASANTWSTTTFITGSYFSSTHNFRANVGPDAGRTYRFTTCSPLAVTTFPYTENFDGVTAGTSVGDYDDSNYPSGFDPNSPLPCGTSTLDANNDGFPMFVIADAGNNGSNALTYFFDDDGATGADDWFFTQALSLRAGYTYSLQFKYAAADASYPESLEVKYGTAATPTAQTGTLFSFPSIVNTSYVTTTASKTSTITPTANGIYYIGFHATSAADQFALFIDDISVTEARVLAVKNSANTLFSAEASPVPFSNNLNLNLTTREAGSLHLTLRDALGRTLRQTTATATVGSSSIAVPGVAGLPAGIYFLDVEQAGQKQVLRVTHE